MKNRLAIYSKLLRDNLTNKGCTFIMQKSETVSKSIILQFHRNNVDGNIINHAVDVLKCVHMVELGEDVVTILLQEENYE